MDDDAGSRVREVCDRWGPVLERFFAEQGITTSEKAGAPIAADVLAATDEAEPELRTIAEEQRDRDADDLANPSHDGISAIASDPDAVRKLDRALVRIRAWSAQD